MDIGFDHATWPPAGNDAAPADAGLDWHGLRARFVAAQAYHGQLRSLRGRALASGSFDAAVAQALAGYEAATPDVNPNGLGDGKGDRPDGGTMPGHPGPAFEGNE